MADVNGSGTSFRIGIFVLILASQAMIISNMSLAHYGVGVYTYTPPNYHANYKKPLRWYGVPHSVIYEVVRFDADDKVCGTLYHHPTNNLMSGNLDGPIEWVGFGAGFSYYGPSEELAVKAINDNCY